MHKYILIAAMVLVSATAQAGGTRGLTLASNDEPTVVAQPKAIDAPAVTTQAPQYVDRPAAVNTPPGAPKADAAKPDAAKNAQPQTAEKPKRSHESTEARVIRELHRHGIYW